MQHKLCSISHTFNLESVFNPFQTLFFISIYRVISVYGLTFLLNRVRLEPIGYVDQFVMAYGGLRGGIAFSLAKLTNMNLVPQVKAMLCSCLVVIFFTSFIQGATIGPIVEWLHVEKEGDAHKGQGTSLVVTELERSRMIPMMNSFCGR